MPIWVEDRIDMVLSRFAGTAIDADVIKQIRADLDAQGLGGALGDFLIQRTATRAPKEGGELTPPDPAQESDGCGSIVSDRNHLVLQWCA